MMHTRKIKIVLIVSAVVLCLFAMAGINKWLEQKKPHLPEEDAQVVFKKIYSKLANVNTDLNINGTITLLDEGTFKEKTSFELVRERYKVYHRFDCIRQISNEKISVQLDTLNKYIYVSKPDKESLKNQKKGILPFADMVEDTSFFRVASLTGNEPAIEIINDFQPEVKSCILKYDPQTYTIRQAIVQWWKQPGSIDNRDYWETIIDYNYNAEKNTDLDEMINTIVTVDRNSIEINPAYKDYQVELSDKFSY